VISGASRAVLAAVAAGFVLRLAFGFGYWVGKPLTHDEREYLALATRLADGHGFNYPAPPANEPAPERFGRAPVYPLFLAGTISVARAVGADGLAAIKFTQSAVGAAGIWLIALLAMQVAGRTAGAVGAWIAALHPPLVWTPAYVFSETLYMTLALTHVLLTARLVSGEGYGPMRHGRWLFSGVLGGVSALTRPAHLFYLMLLGLRMLLHRRAVAAALVVAGALAVIAPWTARNAREYGRLVLIASEGGITFWTGNHRASAGEGDMAANPAIKLDNRRLRAAHPGLTPEQLEPIYYREAFATIARDPVWWIGLLARKLFYTWVPVGPSYRLHSTRYLAASVASYGLLLVAGLAGAAVVIRRGRWPSSLGLLLASAVLVCVVFFPQERFRIPVIDPTLIVLAAAGFALGGRHTSKTSA
jgi:hypothetical protein